MAQPADPTAISSAHDVVPSRSTALFNLFLISGLILFLELACIRWFPAHVLFLTFFTNMVLLACFLGMSLGCLAARHRRRYLNGTPLFLALALMTAIGVEALRDQLENVLDVGNQMSPQMVFFGTEYKVGNVDRFLIPMEVLEGCFFLLITLCMIGPGQELGRAMMCVSDRVLAYTVNIFGSIVGIALFSLCAWLQLSPGWWFLLIVLGLAYFLLERPLTDKHLGKLAFLTGIVLLASTTKLISGFADREEYWSPYYRVDYSPEGRYIRVNLIGHQTMLSRGNIAPAYALPYLLNRDSGGRSFEDILIIGAGSGNDVSRALQWGARHVDAVEIDPRIRALGERDHPDDPYGETDRVTAHQADGRNFLRTTDRKYDLIVYALVDSLVLHSSYSNIRLESYLFTKQAFEDVKHRLKPGGLFVMYNFFRQGWIVARLEKTVEETFGAAPLVFTLPNLDTIEPEKSWDGFTFLIAGDEAALENLRKRFQRSAPGAQRVDYWVNVTEPPGPFSPDGFREAPPEGERQNWLPFTPAQVNQPAELLVATDDWPFLYLRRPMVPALSVRGAAVMGVIAALLLFWFARRGADAREAAQQTERPTLFDGRMFFLGAGFMLIETKAVVHMALLFGSTWMVNSVVFLAVLVMILLANLFVLALRPVRIWPYYIGLFATLALNIVIPLDSFLGWRPELRMLGSCLLVFAPILFAAVIFALSFARTRAADRAFGFNIAGAMLGGLAEYTSMLLGFRYLLLVAIGFYLLSALWRTSSLRLPVVQAPIAPQESAPPGELTACAC